jgi:type II secretory pathway pseudopilin PulG
MNARRGMTLIDVVVGTALILIIFTALFGLLRASVLVSGMVKSEATATAVANNQMEYIRSLPYNSVGTVGGIPSGAIPQNATTTEDGVSYGVRTFVDYYDDPADGLGAADTNGITEDYKRIKVSVTYVVNGKSKVVTFVSNYAPPGLETTVGGGTLQINVVNATGTAVPGATVTITNSSVSPAVNLSTFSDVNGEVFLPGAATSTQYAVTVTKSGYSTAQTYARNGTNQNPTPGYLTVVNNQTTTGTFAIDALSTLTLNTYTPAATSTFSDSFANATKLATVSNTSAAGSLTLSGGVGSYALSGTAISSPISTSTLVSWGVASSTITTPGGTTAVVQIVDGSGNLLPNSVLPGNSIGFTSFPINLYSVSTSTYPTLALMATLTTNSTSVTPSLASWNLSYLAGPIPLPNVSYSLTGAKTIGSTGAGAPIYKTTVSGTTNSSGTSAQTLEWDAYSLSIPSYDILDSCNDSPPYAVSPGSTIGESLILGPLTSNAVLINVNDSTGNNLAGATVTLARSGYSKTVTSSACGNAYFGGITSATDYTITIAKTGYTTNTTSNVTVSGHTFYAVSF